MYLHCNELMLLQVYETVTASSVWDIEAGSETFEDPQPHVSHCCYVATESVTMLLFQIDADLLVLYQNNLLSAEASCTIALMESRVSLCRPLPPLWVTSWKQPRSLASCIMHHLALTLPH